jgi:2-dehydro-3-deoxyphosphogluconate aldolase / (4S)-4-hydroxy-2-oxoglutarate aldolase
LRSDDARFMDALRVAPVIPVLTVADVAAAAPPGATSILTSALRDLDVLAIPGVASASEAMARREEGFTLLKLFPAEIVGGPSLLKSLAAPLPDLQFIPTGGIGPVNAAAYLALSNVAGVGGSWIVTAADMDTRNGSAIETRTRAALAAATGSGQTELAAKQP